jgi:hypothetical protein
MNNDRRLTELESKLTGTQRALAWLKKRQEKGGLIELCRRSLQPPGYIESSRGRQEATEIFVIRDQDSAFAFDCVAECNFAALELAFCGDDVAIRSMYLRRLLHGALVPADELQRFRSILKDFAVEGLALARAVQALSEHHLGVHQILYGDAEKGLADRNANAQKLCELFNEIALLYEAQPIGATELDKAVGDEARKQEEYLISLTRAKVDLRFTGGLNMGRWLPPYLEVRGISSEVPEQP